MSTRTHNLVGRPAAGVCVSRAVSVVPAGRAWSATYATQTVKPEIGMFADHANLSTRRLKEPSP